MTQRMKHEQGVSGGVFLVNFIEFLHLPLYQSSNPAIQQSSKQKSSNSAKAAATGKVAGAATGAARAAAVSVTS